MGKGQEREAVQRVDAAFSALRQAILERALEPGTRLPAEVIGASFEMSRTLAREVLFRLEGIGLVEIRPKRGAIVACPSLAEAQDIFDVRRCLEARSLAHVFENWTPEFERELEEHVCEEEAAAQSKNVGTSINLAENFHIKLSHLSGNQVLAKYIVEVVSRCSLILSLYGSPHSTDCSVSEHRMIVEALKSRDKDGVLNIMDIHLAALQDRATTENSSPSKPGLEQIIRRFAAVDQESKSSKYARK
ncbi:MAG: GntR family transcriptional regulator [Rhodospirillales bacterium]|nr:GntR family transcriptional regulator [Rhodospirillales bacterium]